MSKTFVSHHFSEENNDNRPLLQKVTIFHLNSPVDTWLCHNKLYRGCMFLFCSIYYFVNASLVRQKEKEWSQS